MTKEINVLWLSSVKGFYMNNCNGCDKKCEYGYVKLTGEKYLPKLGEVFVTAYYNESGDRVVLFPDKISPEMARAEAEKIARVCEHNRARVK